MANGDRRLIQECGTQVPPSGSAVNLLSFTLAPGEHAALWGRLMIQATATLQDWVDATCGFYASVERVASGTPTGSGVILTSEAVGSVITTEFAFTYDANGVVTLQFTKQDYRGSAWLYGFGVIQAES